MSFANFKPFRKAKTYATFEFDNEKTYQQLTTTTPSLSLTTTPISYLFYFLNEHQYHIYSPYVNLFIGNRLL